jgi:hypothetical protein
LHVHYVTKQKWDAIGWAIIEGGMQPQAHEKSDQEKHLLQADHTSHPSSATPPFIPLITTLTSVKKEGEQGEDPV